MSSAFVTHRRSAAHAGECHQSKHYDYASTITFDPSTLTLSSYSLHNFWATLLVGSIILQLRGMGEQNVFSRRQSQGGGHVAGSRKRKRTTSIQYPSGSKMNAIFFILPSVRRFLNGTPSRSKRAHASSTLATVIAMWPNPRGSEFPEW